MPGSTRGRKKSLVDYIARLKAVRDLKKTPGCGPIPAGFVPDISPALEEAVEMYNVMGGLDWQALPYVLTMYSVADVPRSIQRLAIVRDAVATAGNDGAH